MNGDPSSGVIFVQSWRWRRGPTRRSWLLALHYTLGPTSPALHIPERSRACTMLSKHATPAATQAAGISRRLNKTRGVHRVRCLTHVRPSAVEGRAAVGGGPS
jgi:hypothetical protein